MNRQFTISATYDGAVTKITADVKVEISSVAVGYQSQAAIARKVAEIKAKFYEMLCQSDLTGQAKIFSNETAG